MDKPRLLFESVLIVASVALGFAVTEWRGRVADRELGRTVLANVVEEIQRNREAIGAQIARHASMIQMLDAAPAPAPGQTAWDVVTQTLKGSIAAVPMGQAAWDAAVSSGALRVIDYRTSATLSEVYMLQDQGYGRTLQRIGQAIYVPDNFRAADAAAMVRMFRHLLVELHGVEQYLLETYEKHLPALREAARE